MCMKSENRTNGKTQVAALISIQQKGENNKTHYSIGKVCVIPAVSNSQGKLLNLNDILLT